MDGPEYRALSSTPWLFGKQGLAILLLTGLVAATFLAADIAFLAGCLLLIGLLARAWAAVAFTRVSYSRRLLSSRAFCGDRIQLESSVANPRPLPLPWLEVWERLPPGLEPEGPAERSYAEPGSVWVQRGVSLWPYQRLRWRRTLACRQRGVYRVGEARLRTGDPFGFIERERTWLDEREVLVYPRVVPLRRLALPLHHPSLDVVSPRSPVTDPTRTATVRDYLPDDPQRLIHWPTTARRGALHVRVLEPASSLHVSLVLDIRGFTFGLYRSQLLEPALSALASVALYLQEQGHPAGFLANTAPPIAIAPGASVAHVQHVLEAMARIEPIAGEPVVPALLDRLPRGSSIVLAASEMTVDLAATSTRLRAAGYSVLYLLGVSHSPARPAPDTIYLTPGCDVAAVLEGRA